jgi:energy-coupling factor transport system permease protein
MMNNTSYDFEFSENKALNDKLPLKEQPTDLDGFLKFILAVGLAALPFFFQNYWSFIVLSIYLLIITVILRIKLKILIISITSYCIMVLIPCLFGIAVQSFLHSRTDNSLLLFNQDTSQLILRLICLLIVWYVSMLFFYTTQLKTIMGLLDKLLSPLSLIGVPIKDYLKIVLCIVIELQDKGSQIKEAVLKSARSFGSKAGIFRINFQGISKVIVSLLVNSLRELDNIENMVKSISAEQLGSYQFAFSKKEGIALLSFAFLTVLIVLIEKGFWN